MMKTLFVQPRATAVGVAGALSRVWIETGNPRRPLACVWIDAEVRAFSEDESRAGEDPAEIPLCA